MDKIRFHRVVDAYRNDGERSLCVEELSKFHFEKYHLLCNIFYIKVSADYRGKISICSTSEALYIEIGYFVKRSNDVNYLRFYLILLLNELEVDCEWLTSLDVDLPFRYGLVSREIRGVFEIKGL
ncbi:hypothetical protein [Maricaulis sp. W15]|uniref:hypothetical protein n=1 Tax=Maricaulis sp. W15 TaxID=1772333 RepID=UPI00117BF9F8|nr:hypothetical protein [Maricaulis sp. W15]